MRITDILKKAGFPQDYVVLDFESYYDSEYSLTKMSAWEYIKDSRFEPLGCGLFWVLKSGTKVKEYVVPEKLAVTFSCMQARYGQELENLTVVIQNAKFDALILKETYGILPRFIIDVKHLDAHQDSKRSHKLKDMALIYGVKEKGRTEDFKGLHWDTMTIEQRVAIATYCKNDCESEQGIFEQLLPRLSWPEMELWFANHSTRLWLDPKLVFNKSLAKQLYFEMDAELEKIIERTGFSKSAISGNKSIVKLFTSLLPEEDALPMKQGKSELIPALAKNDDGCNYLLAHPDPRVANLMEARLAVKSWPNHLKRMLTMGSMSKAAGGLQPVPSNYYGAHTGRSSGGEKINLYNLGGSGRAGTANHPLIQKMRGLLLADVGYMLALSDSAQIEARVLAWLAGCDKLVKGFAEKRDIYSEFATELFGVAVRKPKESDALAVKKDLEIKRGFGKETILASGFGMGPTKFHGRCLANKELRPMFDDGTYTFAFVDSLIQTYRREYKEVPNFWKTIEGLFRWVINNPDNCVGYGKKEFGLEKNLLEFWNDRGTVNLQLPSGRILYYPHAAINKADKEIRYEHGHLWGGTLTENVVQAISRDLLVIWIRQVEEAGIPVVHHVYDEIIGMVPAETAEEDLKRIEDIMCVAPDWADGLPLAAEGKTSVVYVK